MWADCECEPYFSSILCRRHLEFVVAFLRVDQVC
jgi:hypothetical protein